MSLCFPWNWLLKPVEHLRVNLIPGEKQLQSRWIEARPG